MPSRVRVRQGDISLYEGDAVVNAANNHLQLGAGVAGAIRRAGGPTIQQECDRHGPVRVGEAAITSGGDLKAKWVIHAAAMGDEPVSAGSIRASTAASLELASRHGARRIALPVLGAGVGGFDLAESARIMLDTIAASPHATAFDEIVFYGYRSQDADQLRRLVAGDE